VVVLFRVTPVTGVKLTVTEQVAGTRPTTPLTGVTVIVVFPVVTPVTSPFSETVAMFGLLLLQLTFLLVALAGKTVSVNFPFAPTAMYKVGLSRDIPLTGTLPLPLVTVMSQVAVLLPFTVFTVILALPAAMPKTVPFDDTVATWVLLLLHVTFLLVAFEGATVAVKVSEAPMAMLADVLFKLTLVTATFPPPPVTVTEQFAA
jgi:hypothetical protein